MKAMILEHLASMQERPDPLRWVDLPDPEPEPDQLLLDVQACGVCHTELDEIEGRLPPPHLPVVPGHEVVGRVRQVGDQVTRFQVGDRVGVGWIYRSTGAPQENLAAEFQATGCDVNGGYAEQMTVPQDYAAAIPAALSDTQAAPLLCAGAIGYRALRLAELEDGDPLGLMGFGASAHLVLQLARHLYPHSPIYVFARQAEQRDFSLDLGAHWAGRTDQQPPRLLRSVIDTTPAWRPVVESLKSLRPGGRLVINAIRKEDADQDALLDLSYHEHLWMEREIKSVANLEHRDIREFLPLAAEIGIRSEVTEYRLSDANAALRKLREGGLKGACVLVPE
jgi:propanol-preferring alcohol dehydrogenase